MTDETTPNPAREARRLAFAAKNQRRKDFRNANCVNRFARSEARTLRQGGVVVSLETTKEFPDGRIETTKEDIVGIPGAFGRANNDAWNLRIPGTAGEERTGKQKAA